MKMHYFVLIWNVSKTLVELEFYVVPGTDFHVLLC